MWFSSRMGPGLIGSRRQALSDRIAPLTIRIDRGRLTKTLGSFTGPDPFSTRHAESVRHYGNRFATNGDTARKNARATVDFTGVRRDWVCFG